MTMYVLQSWIILLLAFMIGAALSWVVINAMYKPVDKVREDLKRGLTARNGEKR